MNATPIIESYVGAVVRYLPRRQRNDVGFELRSLLTEELEGRSADAGRPADAAMVRELLAAFGRPQDVADRYRPAGFTIIRPADAPRFAWVALIGVAIQWAITLPAALLAAAPFDTAAIAGLEWPSRLSAWWLSWGLGAFWWPGFLVTMMLIAAAISSRREGKAEHAATRVTARTIDPDQVNRPAIVVWMGLAALGASAVIALPSLATWAPGLPQPVLDALALDPDFLRWRAGWLLLLWAAELAIYVAVLIAGRWSRVTQRLSVAVNIAWIALMIWWIAAGPIFVSESADGIVTFCLAGIAVIAAIDTVARLRRMRNRFRPPVS